MNWSSCSPEPQPGRDSRDLRSTQCSRQGSVRQLTTAPPEAWYTAPLLSTAGDVNSTWWIIQFVDIWRNLKCCDSDWRMPGAFYLLYKLVPRAESRVTVAGDLMQGGFKTQGKTTQFLSLTRDYLSFTKKLKSVYFIRHPIFIVDKGLFIIF